MARLIKNFYLDFTDIAADGESRDFSIFGTDGAEFILEIKSNTTGNYYNFVKEIFQDGISNLQGTIGSTGYSGKIVFPSTVTTDTTNGTVSSGTSVTMDTAVATKMKVGDRVTGGGLSSSTVYTVSSLDSEFVFTISASVSIADGATLTFSGDDQYDISLYAVPSSIPELSTSHVDYNEVRFGDDSLDINSSTGSNSLMLRKVIYQYAPIILKIKGYDSSGALGGISSTTFVIDVNRGESKQKVPFNITLTTAATSALRILKQPTEKDILAFVEPTAGTTPVNLPGENIYPEVSNTDTTNATMSSTSLVTMTTNVVDKMKVGDRVTGTGIDSTDTVTVLNITDGTAKQFRASQNVSISSGVTLSFSNQKNFAWPINNFAHLLQPGMVFAGLPGVIVRNYLDLVTVQEGTASEKIIVKNRKKAIEPLKKPTIEKGLITTQEGVVLLSEQQPLHSQASAGFKIGGYGEAEISRIYGWDVKFTDLKITLVEPITTTTESVKRSATINVADREGIINNVSTISGRGIGIARGKGVGMLITSGGGADGAGALTIRKAAIGVEKGATLTIDKTSTTAIMTGNIEIIKAGTDTQTLRPDIAKLFSTSA